MDGEKSMDPEVVRSLLLEGAEQVSRIAGRLPAIRGKSRRGYSLVRWIEDGRDGIRLEGYRDPSVGWFTSLPAVARFFARLTGKPYEPAPHEAEMRRRSDAAWREIAERHRAKAGK
jgi:hypothetical protein